MLLLSVGSTVEEGPRGCLRNRLRVTGMEASKGQRCSVMPEILPPRKSRWMGKDPT